MTAAVYSKLYYCCGYCCCADCLAETKNVQRQKVDSPAEALGSSSSEWRRRRNRRETRQKQQNHCCEQDSCYSAAPSPEPRRGGTAHSHQLGAAGGPANHLISPRMRRSYHAGLQGLVDHHCTWTCHREPEMETSDAGMPTPQGSVEVSIRASCRVSALRRNYALPPCSEYPTHPQHVQQ